MSTKRRAVREDRGSGVSRAVMKSLVAFCAVLGVALLGWFLYYVLGPTVDNRLQIKVSRDLEILRGYQVRGVSLNSLVAKKFVVESWTAYHEDWIFATRVDCRASDPSGRSLLLSWEVRHRNPPRPWMPRRALYITPLTRSAAKLAPELLHSDVLPEDLPLSRYGAGFVYDIAHGRIVN